MNSMEIEVSFAISNTYDSWPRIRRRPKRALIGCAPCAYTGLPKLAGPVQEISGIEQGTKEQQACST